MENLPPIGQFRTTVLQYEVTPDDGSAAAMVMLPRLCNHCDNPLRPRLSRASHLPA